MEKIEHIWHLAARSLNGELTEPEQVAFQQLLQENPEVQQQFEYLSLIWHNTEPSFSSEEATDNEKVKRIIDKASQQVPLPYDLDDNYRRRQRRRRLLYASPILVIIIAFSVWFLQKKPAKAMVADRNFTPKTLAVDNGNRSRFQLLDGSTVWLNAGSKLVYVNDFNGSTRELNLEGEAFFDVVKNPEKPFIIHTAKIDVKVLGTQFNVKAYEEDKTTETSLIRGSVEVLLRNEPSKTYRLKPNEKLILNNQTVPTAVPTMNEADRRKVAQALAKPEIAITGLRYLENNELVESSWVRNILSFEDEQFSEVAKKMQRWYDVTIQFKNKNLEKKYLSGSFETETLEQALAALKFTTGFNYSVSGNRVTIY